MKLMRALICAVVFAIAALAAASAQASITSTLLGNQTSASTSTGPAPGSPEYFQRDNQNMMDAYGRQTAPGGQLEPSYIQSLPGGTNAGYLQQVADQAANPTRPILDPGQWFPGWNQGNANRQNWAGNRGVEVPVAFTNRYGALLRGDVYAPLPGARDPYTGRRLRRPYPGVVITTGSIPGAEGMYGGVPPGTAGGGGPPVAP